MRLWVLRAHRLPSQIALVIWLLDCSRDAFLWQWYLLKQILSQRPPSFDQIHGYCTAALLLCKRTLWSSLTDLVLNTISSFYPQADDSVELVYICKEVLTSKTQVSGGMQVSYCNTITWYNNKAETHLWRKSCYSPESLLSCSCTNVFWPKTLLKCYTWHVCPFRETVYFLRGWNHTYYILSNYIIIVPPNVANFYSVCILL